MKKTLEIEDTELHTWFERDRASVELTDKESQETLLEFWDEEVYEAIEDGFLDPRNYHKSMFQLWQERS